MLKGKKKNDMHTNHSNALTSLNEYQKAIDSLVIEIRS